MILRRVLLLAAVLSAAACNDKLPHPQLVDNLRIVGVQAEPPNGPVGTAIALSALVMVPDQAQAATVEQAWAACVVSPGQPIQSCALPGPGELPPMCADAPDAPLCLLGNDPTASYTLPARARQGVAETAKGQVVITLVAADQAAGGVAGCAAAFEDPANAPADCRAAVKQIDVLPGGSPTDNTNPGIATFTADDKGLHITLADGAADQTPDGPETLYVSWYVTGGDLDKFRTDGDATGLDNEWKRPTEPGTYQAAVVLRDGRGGESWKTLDVSVP